MPPGCSWLSVLLIINYRRDFLLNFLFKDFYTHLFRDDTNTRAYERWRDVIKRFMRDI